MEDVEGRRTEVRFYRDAAGHEVDAIVMRERKPWMAVELKLGDRPVDRGLRYLVERLQIPWAFQVSVNGTRDRRLPGIGQNGIRQLPLTRLLLNLPRGPDQRCPSRGSTYTLG